MLALFATLLSVAASADAGPRGVFAWTTDDAAYTDPAAAAAFYASLEPMKGVIDVVSPCSYYLSPNASNGEWLVRKPGAETVHAGLKQRGFSVQPLVGDISNGAPGTPGYGWHIAWYRSTFGSAAFAAKVKSEIASQGLDGLNFDYEPRDGGGANDTAAYAAMLDKLSAQSPAAVFTVDVPTMMGHADSVAEKKVLCAAGGAKGGCLDMSTYGGTQQQFQKNLQSGNDAACPGKTSCSRYSLGICPDCGANKAPFSNSSIDYRINSAVERNMGGPRALGLWTWPVNASSRDGARWIEGMRRFVKKTKTDEAVDVMPNLLLPPWPPTYNLTKSTMTQSCFGPARINKNTPQLSAATGAFMRSWGIITLDFESQEQLWGKHSPKDSDTMMLDEAVKMKAIAPDTKIWIYRNLAQAYSNFGQFREKIEDPAYAGWWLPFGPDNTLPKCEFNARLNKSLCSDFFHARSGWTENGHDCGDVIPCGDYVFNHRNQSLRKWLVEEHMLGKMGMGHPAVDGYLIDDWYTKWRNDSSGEVLYGPSEIAGFIGKNGGIEANSTVMKELFGNWSLTTQQALRGVSAAGGFTWSGFNCMLDTDNGYGCPPSDLAGCGLHKTEGVPRADNVASAPLWHGRRKGWASAATCAAWTRQACSPTSVFSRIPTEIAFGNDTYADVAQFLLTRGPYGYLGWGWHGCVNAPPPSAAYDYDFGEPVGLCTEVAAGVFTRTWTKATVTMNCNTNMPNITLAGHSEPIKPRPPPRSFSSPGKQLKTTDGAAVPRRALPHLKVPACPAVAVAAIELNADGSAKPAKGRTSVDVCHNATHLSFLYRCANSGGELVNSSFKRACYPHAGKRCKLAPPAPMLCLFQEASTELFIAEGKSGCDAGLTGCNWELDMSARGGIYVNQNRSPNGTCDADKHSDDVYFEGDCDAAGRPSGPVYQDLGFGAELWANRTGWDAAYALPFHRPYLSGKGRFYRANFHRNGQLDYQSSWSAGPLPAGECGGTWPANCSGFHCPRNFGLLELV